MNFSASPVASSMQLHHEQLLCPASKMTWILSSGLMVLAVTIWHLAPSELQLQREPKPTLHLLT